MLSSALVLASVLCGQFDASIPDASVDQGGAETSQEMDDGRSNTVCAASRDCERGFSCNAGRCRYVGYRVASQPGCTGATAFLAVPPMLFLRWRRRQGG